MKNQRIPRIDSGWTFVEMLVAISLSAIFLGTAALVFQAINHNSKRLTTLIKLDIGEANKTNFFNLKGSTVTTYTAPNYGKLVFAQDIRESMLADADRSSAVYCLPRSGLNTIRQEFITYPSGNPGSSSPHPQIDTPEAFRKYLRSVYPTKAAVFDSPIRNVPLISKMNTSVFMLAPQQNPNMIRLYAVYDIDYVTPKTGGGMYVSVKRFKNGNLSSYYDAYYPGATVKDNSPAPQFVVFESKNRKSYPEGQSIDRFKVAPNSPFYFVWLPDPAINFLDIHSSSMKAPPSSSPREAYYNQATRTSFMLVLPMFPSL